MGYWQSCWLFGQTLLDKKGVKYSKLVAGNDPYIKDDPLLKRAKFWIVFLLENGCLTCGWVLYFSATCPIFKFDANIRRISLNLKYEFSRDGVSCAPLLMIKFWIKLASKPSNDQTYSSTLQHFLNNLDFLTTPFHWQSQFESLHIKQACILFWKYCFYLGWRINTTCLKFTFQVWEHSWWSISIFQDKITKCQNK